jgi:hypothetical protein
MQAKHMPYLASHEPLDGRQSLLAVDTRIGLPGLLSNLLFLEERVDEALLACIGPHIV